MQCKAGRHRVLHGMFVLLWCMCDCECGQAEIPCGAEFSEAYKGKKDIKGKIVLELLGW